MIGVRLASRFEGKELPVLIHERPDLSRAYMGVIIAAVLVVVSGICLAGTGEEIAKATGWGRTFVGSVFLAIVTSFPEVVVSVAALRLGSIDLAFGNIFGSNMINLFLISLTDVAYRGGAILACVSKVHVLTASLGVFLTGVAIVGLSRRRKNTLFHLGWDTIIMLLGCLLGIYALFKFSTS